MKIEKEIYKEDKTERKMTGGEVKGQTDRQTDRQTEEENIITCNYPFSPFSSLPPPLHSSSRPSNSD